MNQSSIIVSGATGFVGQNLLPYLSNNGFKVAPLSRKRTKETDLTYDSLQSEDWNNASAFVHLAGKAHDVKNTAGADIYFKVNRDLTIDLFNQFLESSCETFIFLSSVKAAADQVEGVLTEEVTPSPQTPYGKSKQAAEEHLLKHLNIAGKKVYILRPCMIHGAGNKGNLNLLYQVAAKRIPYPLGSYFNKRSFLSVDHLNEVIQQLIEKQPASGIYNLADDEAISTVELIQLMGKVMNRNSIIFKVPKPIINTTFKVGGFLKLPFNPNALQKLTESYVVDNSKIKKELDIQTAWNTREGLKKTIKSFEITT